MLRQDMLPQDILFDMSLPGGGKTCCETCVHHVCASRILSRAMRHD